MVVVKKTPRFAKQFDLKYLEEAIEDESSSISLHTMRDHVAFHPYHLKDLNKSVAEILNEKVGKFYDNFEGIICGYKNIKLLSETGQICSDSCFIHVDIEADFYIFKPMTSKLLSGMVNKISKDHVGCLVHKVFNVSLPRPKKEKEWIGDSVNYKSVVELKINATNFDGKLPYIKGEITQVLYNPEPKEDNKKEKRGKKRRKSQTSFSEEANETLEDTPVKKPKKKKIKKE